MVTINTDQLQNANMDIMSILMELLGLPPVCQVAGSDQVGRGPSLHPPAHMHPGSHSPINILVESDEYLSQQTTGGDGYSGQELIKVE